MKTSNGWWLGIFFVGCIALNGDAAVAPEGTGEILTPPPPATPRINSPSVFGVTPGAPFLYTIPATGERPMEFSVDGLPAGLTVSATDGRITGVLKTADEHVVMLRARNARGQVEKKFTIVCGDRIALTPPMGWNSWNCWAQAVDQEKVLRSAHSLVSSGLSQHGWTYVNIDDTWQGKRDGSTLALQPNERFTDMKKLCSDIHALGLKAGIYSSPWITTFAGYPGGSSDDAKGAWERLSNYEPNKRLGRYSFTKQDAAQWGEWGMDYLKYDWAPNDLEHVKEMSLALRATGRDIVFSLSCSTPMDQVAEFSRWANCWRTTGDIWDTWDIPGPWQNGVSAIGFNQDPWTPYSGPGHWNDPDMLVIGYVGWGPQLHLTRLTPNEQYSHITLWCLLSAPLLIGCDLDRLDPFTLNLLTNDEVLAVDQDALGRQARRMATSGPIDIYRKELEDGSVAVGYFNRGDTVHTFATKLERYGLGGRQRVRDLWRQQDLPEVVNDLTLTVPPHGVLLYKFTTIR
jgi:alpha-galactosidase